MNCPKREVRSRPTTPVGFTAGFQVLPSDGSNKGNESALKHESNKRNESASKHEINKKLVSTEASESRTAFPRWGGRVRRA